MSTTTTTIAEAEAIYEAANAAAWETYYRAVEGPRAIVEGIPDEGVTPHIWQLYELATAPATATRNAAVLAAQNAYRAATRPGGPLGRGLI